MSFDDRDLTDQLDTLYRYALGTTGDPDLAADVVQDTVVRAIERRDQYRSDAPLGH
jgi:DNA-directed RNA polymerase specialized sigma24 family protein